MLRPAFRRARRGRGTVDVGDRGWEGGAGADDDEGPDLTRATQDSGTFQQRGIGAFATVRIPGLAEQTSGIELIMRAAVASMPEAE